MGSVSTLVAVMGALEFRLTGLGPGKTLGEQLRNKRLARNWSLRKTADKTGLAVNTVVCLEGDGGSVASLQVLIQKLAPTARRRAPERAYWGQGDKEDRDARFTPPGLLGAVTEAFGSIDIDPCGHELSPVQAKRSILLSEGGDGLRDDWSGRLAFVNPPFSEQQKWLRRAHDQWSAGRIEVAVCLVPTRTDSQWFHEVLSQSASIYFLKGRVRFTDPRGRTQATPHSVMLVILGAAENEKVTLASQLPGVWML